jgi:CDP-diacylglycerol--glycerol-3-phosphate 3-phosphatidyltransferase
MAYLPFWVPGRFSLLSVVALWIIFALIESSDFFDGMAARAQGTVSDLGKLLDPFADVIARLTYFFVFAAFSIMPPWMFILILYREVGIIFIRMMLTRDGVVLAARKGGKLKAAVYALSSGIGLLMLMHVRLQNLNAFMPWLPWVAIWAFLAAVVLAWVSFIDYLIVTRRHYKNRASG